MRGNPEAHQLVAEPTLAGVLARLAGNPGMWTPIAGGTELMVAHAAGRLTATSLINLWGIPELQGITASSGNLSIGAGVTFSQIRRSAEIAEHFPLLNLAASWIGSVANQSRATIAGNIVNGSPAADAPPALLVYDAAIELISAGSRRTLPYADFHLGYKQNRMRPDELVLALHLPMRFGRHKQYLRKVGARRAMAITKVALAGTAIVADGHIAEIRLAAASLADRPLRLTATESALAGKPINAATRQAARSALLGEVKPIDDIRSTALYRSTVAANLLEEFLDRLAQDDAPGMNATLALWNESEEEQAVEALLHCCAARRWAEGVAALRPFSSEDALLQAADEVWAHMQEADWLEAFRAHPRIGERKPAEASAQSSSWSRQEQASVSTATSATLEALRAGNERYEQLFGLTYIVCATGKSAEEMLHILERRLTSDRSTELREAAEQQRQITGIRLRKWLNP
jgi:OHCU decarboxylase